VSQAIEEPSRLLRCLLPNTIVWFLGFREPDLVARADWANFTAFRIESLEASLDRAREIALQEELEAVGHYIEEAQGYLAQIRVLHQEALEEFSRAQGE
jgi:hypothetical protein